MSRPTIRTIATALLLLCLSACAYETGPAGEPSITNVNPETGTRGGSSTRS